jgi:hypothetical protein
MLRAGQNCGSCRFSSAFPEPVGECRRHAPVVLPLVIGQIHSEMTVWPKVAVGDWCGDYQSAEAYAAPDPDDSLPDHPF